MAQSPPILVYSPGGGVSSPIGSNPPVYSQAGTTALVEGQDYLDVVFGSIQTNDEWELVGCIVVNEIDVTPLNIWPGIITDKTEAGFRIYFNGMPDSGNYYLHWSVSGINIEPSVATTYTLTGPATGAIDEAATFTVALPPSTYVNAPVIVTPSETGLESGVFSPETVTLTTDSPSATFTFTPAVYGETGIMVTNDRALTDPVDLTFTVLAGAYDLSGPSAGTSGVASTDFTVALPVGGVVTGTVTVTPSDSGAGGTFTPTTATLTTAAPSDTFTYTPASTGVKTISVTNDGGLTDPGNLTYTVTGIALLDTLISYWKLDEAAGAGDRMDSHGTNHLTQPAGNVNMVAGKINNGAYASGGAGVPYLACASNASLQVTSDFTFSAWVRVDDLAAARPILCKIDAGFTTNEYYLQHDPAGVGFKISVAGIAVSVGSNATPFAWYHVVAWYDSSDSKLRIRVNDGTTYTSAGTASLVQSTANLGVLATGYGQVPWNGIVDEIGFWKRLLTAGEITALYNSGSGLPYSSFTA